MNEKTQSDYIKLAGNFYKTRLAGDDITPKKITDALKDAAFDYRPAYWRKLRNALAYEQQAKGFKKSADRINETKNPLTASDAPEIAYATASFGQGIATTPLQVITAISSLANGGKLMQPFVNSKTTPKVVRQVISSDTARKVRQMMVTAVETNVVAVIKGYDIGAKTGTAQLASNGVYGDKVINTYVGFAPANDPRFTILVKLNEPAGAPLSGRTVVPVFRELAQFLLNYYEIPPTNVVN